MKIVTISSNIKSSHYLFYRERAVDKPREYYEVVFFNYAGEWNVEVFSPNGEKVEDFTGQKFETLSLAIMSVDEQLSNLTGETK